jgi:hypothetical protein
MEKEKLSPREAGKRQAQAPEKPDLVERMAQIMAEERAETARRKKKMRRYGLIGSAAILAAFALWMMRVFSRRR